MDNVILTITLVLLFTLLGAALAGYLAYSKGREAGVKAEKERQDALRQGAEEHAARIIAEAEAKARQTQLAIKEEEVQRRKEMDAEAQRRRIELEKIEERLQNRLDTAEKRLQQIENRERKLAQREQRCNEREAQLASAEEAWLNELQRVANMTVEEAQKVLLERVEQQTRQEMARKIREVEAQAAEEADRRAREIITLAIERIASDHVNEFAVSTVDLPSDEMKGRIIGRQGRNIRAIEQALGVDLVVDDTPEAIIISSFDPIRREVARMALSKLVSDGRIHPARIEKEVEKAQQEIERIIIEAGEQAMLEAGVSGLHRELQKILGRLKFRTSYGQNQLAHAIETAKLAGVIAAELHANVKVAKMGGLLHDIGKAVSHEIEGPHAIVGAEIARRYNVPEVVVNAIASHHGEVEPESIEAVIVAAADAISGARPGARRESLETYIKRVTELEEIGNSFKGVSQTYAIQAGREIRVLVRPEEIDDLAAIQLSRDIAKKIEDNLQYPGQIRVTVVRETRAVEYAK
ncbi:MULTISPECIES: ribonuclease Y [Caldilinea]|jgi:ribonuclease Y|uniref:Ribonuclease Y n=1 Tax=Caldilinea aerophila (strain DSM 14535 / JCM 11387 / NBRC 104270 / STL-6-O1) TaxID=926550 RepID=I0HYF5_CALAS|nr:MULTISPECIES: ribonuclease Y [Caldilinea]MBO9391318.1 ribonuclease Y [Caldilinea sp.]BAL98042.1 ribonuclease Y [Caldilinea aerophila DSM 14535 = NBRC 104270]GIV75361.1 MAG: ribonuclease Y [Caldilinea sp.]